MMLQLGLPQPKNNKFTILRKRIVNRKDHNLKPAGTYE